MWQETDNKITEGAFKRNGKSDFWRKSSGFLRNSPVESLNAREMSHHQLF